MAEHIHAQVLRWIAQGLSKEIECRCEAWPDSKNWQSLLGNTSEHLGTLIKEEWDDRYEFRLKPRTVKIGNREVEAPVLEPEAGQRLWYWDSYHAESSGAPISKEEAASGEWFASPEAAESAFRAYTALLRGEA